MYTLILNEAIRVVSVLTSIFEDVFIEFVEEVAESVPHDVIVRASGLSRPHTTHAVPHILCNVTVILLTSQDAAISQQDQNAYLAIISALHRLSKEDEVSKPKVLGQFWVFEEHVRFLLCHEKSLVVEKYHNRVNTCSTISCCWQRHV